MHQFIRKPRQIAALLLTIVVIGSASAQTVTVTDVNTLDLNAIANTSQSGTTLSVREIYGERFTTPYPSHDGNAVINAQGGYFDKVVTITGWDPNVDVRLEFSVQNQTPWTWSDYHFEFWDRNFENRIDLQLVQASSDIFDSQSQNSKMVEFWAPSWQQIGQTGTYSLTFTPDLSPLGTQTFGLRQVATVPEPETYGMLLAGLGLLGFVARRRKS